MIAGWYQSAVMSRVGGRYYFAHTPADDVDDWEQLKIC